MVTYLSIGFFLVSLFRILSCQLDLYWRSSFMIFKRVCYFKKVKTTKAVHWNLLTHHLSRAEPHRAEGGRVGDACVDDAASEMPTFVSLTCEFVGQVLKRTGLQHFTPLPHFKMKYLHKKSYGFLMRSEDVARASVLKNEFTNQAARPAKLRDTFSRVFPGLGLRALQKVTDSPFLEDDFLKKIKHNLSNQYKELFPLATNL